MLLYWWVYGIRTYNVTYQVGSIVFTPIRNNAREVGHLQWGSAQFTLPYRERNHCERVPSPLVEVAVVKVRSRYNAV